AARSIFAAASGDRRYLDLGRARRGAGPVLCGGRDGVLSCRETAPPGSLTHGVCPLGGRQPRLSRTATVLGPGRRVFSSQSAYLWALCSAHSDALGATRGGFRPSRGGVWSDVFSTQSNPSRPYPRGGPCVSVDLCPTLPAAGAGSSPGLPRTL